MVSGEEGSGDVIDPRNQLLLIAGGSLCTSEAQPWRILRAPGVCSFVIGPRTTPATPPFD